MGKEVTRRDFVAIAGAAAAGVAAGCATNPTTGRTQFMLVSEAQEVDLDRKAAPHQFSADYGPVQDPGLNSYVGEVGMKLAAVTHRPAMPYSFRVLNSVVVNGYTFPAGSVGLNRGLMVAMGSEAELAAVLGHELGHVNARHAAERMSKNMVAMAMVTGIALYVQKENSEYAALAAGLGGLGANALLCRYSRDDEREADALGMEYMSRAGYGPEGMVSLMDVFRNLHRSKPSAVDLLFSTHPMSDERYETACRLAAGEYAAARGRADSRDRYLDRIGGLLRIRGAIEEMQNAQALLMKKKPAEAEARLKSALRQAPDDYAGLLMMAKCCMAQNRADEAARYADRAKSVYPSEAHALQVSGFAKLSGGRFDAAMVEFEAYETKLPGNENTAFFLGRCLEGMGRRQECVAEYIRYRKQAPAGAYAGYVQNRLVEWGYLKPVSKGR
ncbi:MAG: tetratricopeptide repeat protein [Lentisphaerae bacterium]|nr:tetratricopeptide repeat protein [Lentisphaerota bacterium]